MLHAYTEDQLVEQPAIGLFAELGWTTVSGPQNLRRTRDPATAGLPRLLSGQVEVSESNVKTGAPAA
jgi:type I restriction enzyme R subunit